MFREFVRDNADVPVGMLVRGGCKEDPGDEVIAAYEAPYPTPESKAGARAFPLILPTEPDAPGAAEGKAVADALREDERPTLRALGRLGHGPAASRLANGSPSSSTTRRRVRSRTPATSCRRTPGRRSAGSSPSGFEPPGRALNGAAQLVARSLDQQALAPGRSLVLEPGDRARPVRAGRRCRGGGRRRRRPSCRCCGACRRRPAATAASLSSGPARWVWPVITWAASTCSRREQLGSGGDAVAGDRGGGDVGREVGAQ